MPSWLAEDPTLVTLLLATLALALGLGWWSTRKRKLAWSATGILLLIILIWVLATLIVTDDEQIVQNLEALARATDQRQLDQAFTHVASDFEYGAGMKKSAFRKAAEHALKQYNARDIRIWDLETKNVSRANRSGTIEFQAKATGDWQGGTVTQFYRCRAKFVLEQDGQWRMRNFGFFSQAGDPIPIPGVGPP